MAAAPRRCTGSGSPRWEPGCPGVRNTPRVGVEVRPQVRLGLSRGLAARGRHGLARAGVPVQIGQRRGVHVADGVGDAAGAAIRCRRSGRDRDDRRNGSPSRAPAEMPATRLIPRLNFMIVVPLRVLLSPSQKPRYVREIGASPGGKHPREQRANVTSPRREMRRISRPDGPGIHRGRTAFSESAPDS